eukprot:m.100182 g.100182  ORF g.100182 m.100182 type:complete len:53 (-) comp15379_c0_seq1:250-408(-)
MGDDGHLHVVQHDDDSSSNEGSVEDQDTVTDQTAATGDYADVLDTDEDEWCY